VKRGLDRGHALLPGQTRPSGRPRRSRTTLRCRGAPSSPGGRARSGVGARAGGDCHRRRSPHSPARDRALDPTQHELAPSSGLARQLGASGGSGCRADQHFVGPGCAGQPSSDVDGASVQSQPRITAVPVWAPTRTGSRSERAAPDPGKDIRRLISPVHTDEDAGAGGSFP
jgi:hypothetical protein